MPFLLTNHEILAAYGVGSGNAPTLAFCSVGHLRAAFFKLLKTKSYEQITE
jgi:C4-dicarboxylate transporter